MKHSTKSLEWLISLAKTLAIVALLLMPMLVYVWVFGIELSRDHQRWSEMGAAMSGIYTPILTLLTLAVLVAQFKLQASINRHTFDQSFVQQARDKITFSLEQLAIELSKDMEEGRQIKSSLFDKFAYAKAETLAMSSAVNVAKSINRQHPRVVALWSEFYSGIAGLRTHDFDPYSTAYTSMKQRAISMLSYEGCVALDNFVWCVSERKLKLGYEYSDAATL